MDDRSKGSQGASDNLRRPSVLCVGTGLIGCGWIAHFLRAGFHVAAYDPSEDAVRRVELYLESVWPLLSELGMGPNSSRDRLSIVSDICKLDGQYDLVQESGPEELSVKQRLLGELSEQFDPSVVIASSTAGHCASDLRVYARHPERLFVGHPFNPPWLVPLVEISGRNGGDSTSLETLSNLYKLCGSAPVVLRTEIRGFIGNRIQAAVLKELLHMHSLGIASATELEMAVRCGPGIRWALLGPSEVFLLGAGSNERFPRFLDEIAKEIDTGFVAGDSFRTASADLKLYASEIIDGTKLRPINKMSELRDSGLVSIRKLLDDFPMMEQTRPNLEGE
jgi:carnitine 3-dehydrogenase